MIYNTLIIDDERLARLALRKDLEKFPEINIIGEASGFATAKELITRLKPDLLFLDIQLTDGNGFDLLNQVEYSGEVIFVTAYDEFAIRAFEVNALDYLVKPSSIKRLKVAIDRLSDKQKANPPENVVKLEYNDRLLVIHRNSANFIKIDTITHISASQECSYLHTTDGKEYLTARSIAYWEHRLPDAHFCRVHRSTILNFNYISKINHNITGTGEAYLHHVAEPLSISRNYFKVLKNRYSV
jgi:two-component system LytT family response regulator